MHLWGAEFSFLAGCSFRPHRFRDYLSATDFHMSLDFHMHFTLQCIYGIESFLNGPCEGQV